MQSMLIGFVHDLVIGLAAVKLKCLLCHFTLSASPQLFERLYLKREISVIVFHS